MRKLDAIKTAEGKVAEYNGPRKLDQQLSYCWRPRKGENDGR
jgi:hypothetical protein